jgi:predicted transcriptional regulator
MTTREPLVGLFTKNLEKPSDLLCCAFGLRSSEIDVYFSLLGGTRTVEDLERKIDRDRSTVQRILQKLDRKGLIEREKKRIERGGYFADTRTARTLVHRNQKTLVEHLARAASIESTRLVNGSDSP